HYLSANTTAATGYSGAVPGNLGYTTGFADNGGVALHDAANMIIDQVGIATTGTAYSEGTPIPTQLPTNADRGYERKPGGLSLTLQDTGDNSADFQLTAPSNPQNVAIVASPSSVDFGSLVAPGSVSQPVTIRNLLLAQVTLNATVIGDAEHADARRRRHGDDTSDVPAGCGRPQVGDADGHELICRHDCGAADRQRDRRHHRHSAVVRLRHRGAWLDDADDADDRE